MDQPRVGTIILEANRMNKVLGLMSLTLTADRSLDGPVRGMRAEVSRRVIDGYG